MAAQLEDILRIPGNEAVYKQLQALLKEAAATAFVGAGASAGLFPLWPQLIRKLAHEPVERGLADAAAEEYWLGVAKDKPLQAAQQIRQKLGDSLYYTFLFETFKDRKPAYTSAHSALMRMNFKAWLTTNYDSGLTEAGQVNRYAIWNQTFEVNRWLNGDIFQDGRPPVLFAHGHHADPQSIVLDRDSYRRAYQAGPYRRLFENLWVEHHLVFVGFSFSDVVLEQIADEVLWQLGAPAMRHIAILGLDGVYTAEMRSGSLNAEKLFYPVADHDHSALGVLLESLTREAPKPVPVHVARETPGTGFLHEATDDEKFTGRKEELARLDRWAADPAVRLIAITGIGGLGKTALVSRWLRQSGRRFFFWSYYRNQSTAELLKALQSFGPLDVVALDGLEVIQEVPGTVAYGKLLDLQLAELLHQQVRARDNIRFILTSRFPFPDLTQYLGRGLQLLTLPALAESEGAALLAGLGVRAGEADRKEISSSLEGHPLALRLYARSGSPVLPSDGTLEAKMRSMLDFYEQHIPESQAQALSLVALFRAPVEESALVPLWEKLLGKTEGLARALQDLHREHLLTADPGPDGQPRYACHPILRDHFRQRILGQQALARQAADLLAGPPDAAAAMTLEKVQVVSTAIEALIDAGEMRGANDLWHSRLKGGYLFLSLPAPHWGLEVAHTFVRSSERREAMVSQINQRTLVFFLVWVGVLANNSGQPEIALEYYAEAEKIDRAGGDKLNLAIDLQNIAETKTTLGMLAEAIGHAVEGYDLAAAIPDRPQIRRSAGYRAHAESMRGDIGAARAHFEEADSIEQLAGVGATWWAEFLIRTGNFDRARELTDSSRKTAVGEGWHQIVGQCEWIYGWLETLASNWSAAHAHLNEAKGIFTRGHVIHDLARALLVEALCCAGEGDKEAAVSACDRALDYAAPRNYRLIHADALNVRARITSDASTSRDYAESALQLAEFCEYAWAQRDSAEILARAYRELGDQSRAMQYAKAAAEWTRRLTPSAG